MAKNTKHFQSKKRGKNKGTGSAQVQTGQSSETSSARAFSFGDPEPIMDGRIEPYLGSYLTDNGTYYQTPIPFGGIARLRYANAYHWPMLEFKCNMVMRGFGASKALNRHVMKKTVFDYLVFANCYWQQIKNGFGEVIELRHLPAINMRKGKKDNLYCLLSQDGQIINFQPGEVLHLKNYDVVQDIYGMPSYLGAIHSMLLQEDATLFRRKYYKNGAHMGYIFYSSSGALDPNDQEAIREQMKKSKGVGNFRNLFLHIPNGKEKDIQIIPVGDFSTRDDLEKIKNISRDDIIAAHRIPPALANIIPQAIGGLGDITKADEVYTKNEIIPLRDEFLTVNEVLPPRLRIRFEMDVNKKEQKD